MGSFSITNNSHALLTRISSATDIVDAFNITSGSLPVDIGQSISGTHIEINDDKGNQNGTINLFFIDGYTKITYIINQDTVFTEKLFGSGFAQLTGPVVSESDDISITIEDAVPYPRPTPTPSSTAVVVSPTPTSTPTPTPSNAAPIPLSPADLNALWWIDFTDPSNVVTSGDTILQAYNEITNNIDFDTSIYYDPADGPIYDSTGYNSVSGTAQVNIAALTSLNDLYSATTSTEWTVAYKIYLTGTTNNGLDIVAGYNGATGTDYYMESGIWGESGFTNEENTYIYTTGNSYVELSSYVYPTDTWKNIIIKFHNYKGYKRMKTYIDGTLYQDKPYSGGEYRNLTGIQFDVLKSNELKGTFITEVSYFDYALTDGQITSLFTYLTQKYS